MVVAMRPLVPNAKIPPLVVSELAAIPLVVVIYAAVIPLDVIFPTVIFPVIDDPAIIDEVNDVVPVTVKSPLQTIPPAPVVTE